MPCSKWHRPNAIKLLIDTALPIQCLGATYANTLYIGCVGVEWLCRGEITVQVEVRKIGWAQFRGGPSK